ncbi:DNA ligase [Xylanibacillus composti]|uniref:DNA ligase (ATP) n=1 Tax=Xylanibacillus composti TaxID=1572762 RepID=A0A8J4H1P3_9BACL|nr:RNA ligase family protein [Xylanibacillus composti]MDT9723847.1 DNA ligase [Xylanibacillus composti]GIQ67374.1 DNA ligase [Xylanibacillus composti]
MKLQPVIPFEPVSADQPPQAGKWAAQIKWDGVRMLAYWDGEELRLINRKLNDRTIQYPELHDPESYCKASSFILDGEIIAFNHQRPSFAEVMKRDSLRKQQSIERAVKQVPIVYMVYDILYCNGSWVTSQKLADRQKLLKEVLIPGERVQLVQNYYDPELLLKIMRQHQMEGIVCKDLDSTYALNGKDDRWQKTKLYADLHAVIGGATFRGNVVNALLLGVYEQGRLRYIGHAGTGKLGVADWRDITERIRPMIIAESPFANEPERSKDAVWVRPELCVKVQFLEWTPGGTMRQPSIQAFVDTPAAQCTLS